MKFATMEHFESIWEIFSSHRKTVFPHIRQDYVKRQIAGGNVIFESGVVIIFNTYKRRQLLGKAHAEKDDVVLHQIVVKQQGKGKASRVIQKFFKYVGTTVFLTVRKSNVVARSFYERNGMKVVSKITWSNGALPGLVFKTNSVT